MAIEQHDHLTYVQTRLGEWGAWQRELGGDRLGYPRQASHLVINSGSFSAPSIDNDSAEEMERIMSTLKLMYYNWYQALEQTYVWIDTPDHEAASRLRVSVSTLRKYRGYGEAWLAGRLSEV